MDSGWSLVSLYGFQMCNVVSGKERYVPTRQMTRKAKHFSILRLTIRPKAYRRSGIQRALWLVGSS